MYINSSNNPLQAAAASLNNILLKYQDRPLLLVLSGGSSLGILPLIDTAIFNSNFTITTLDDRYSDDVKINTFAQIAATDFYQEVEKNGASFIDTRPQMSETGIAMASRIDNALKDWLNSHADGVVVATVGIGIDGHVAGIMPGVTQDFLGEEFCVYYEFPVAINQYNQRLTTTYSFLARHVKEAVVYAAGNNKLNALQLVLAENGELDEVPARVLLMIPEVHLFTDIEI